MISNDNSSYNLTTADAMPRAGKQLIQLRAHWNSIKNCPERTGGVPPLVLHATRLNGNIMEGAGDAAVLVSETEAYKIIARRDEHGSYKRPMAGARLSEAAARTLWATASAEGVTAGDLTGSTANWSARIAALPE